MSRAMHYWCLPLMLISTMGAQFLGGCSENHPLAPELDSQTESQWDAIAGHGAQTALSADFQRARTPPADLVTIDFAGEDLTFWPYTGKSFNGEPADPVNLVFVGQADPLQIRAALLSLDGDRTAFGLPPVFPFNAVWTDCNNGDVQTGYADDGEGWSGSVIQLSLGQYETLRFHLRLFRTGKPFAGGCWTLGSIHFEVMIPGTADHQVLSWELAQGMVVLDLMRSGLLDPMAHQQTTGPINAAPSFHDIPAEIYNELPPELIALIEGPPQPVGAPVPLPSDGEATILNLAGSVPVTADSYYSTLTVKYDQYVPKPFCSDGPYDWLYVTGPVTFDVQVDIDPSGLYTYKAQYAGVIQALPIDISTGQPVGEPFDAKVSGKQNGYLGVHASRVLAVDRRLTRQHGQGNEIFSTRLKVIEGDSKTYRESVHCLDDDL